MGNVSGVAAILAVMFRPSLIVPHVQVPDIRHLDWEALHANGVRFLVFDKDNCLTSPHSDVLEPSITDAWQRCQRVFGRENILIVSNSSGSSDDPSGLGAESLSRALDVPVLCHKQKKPSSGCAVEALEYFVALSYDKENTLAQASHMPPGSGSNEAGSSRQTKKYLRDRRKVLKSQVPADERGAGNVLLVGDRTMTDVVVAHRMNDELRRRSRKLGLDAILEASTTRPSPQCISVLTTSIWTYEGRLNAVMRKIEIRLTAYLVAKGFQPGSPGLLSFRKSSTGIIDWQSIASKNFTNPQNVVAQLSRDDAVNFVYTGDRVPPASPVQPSLGTILIAAIVRPLPPRIASFITSILSRRPLVWVSSNLRDGWNVMIKGLEFGVREAGISYFSRSRKIACTAKSSLRSPATSDGPNAYDIEEDVAPRNKTQAKKQAVSATLSDYIDARMPSSLPTLGAAQRLLSRFNTRSFSAQNFLGRFSHLQKSPASTSSSIDTRTLHTSARRFDRSHPNPHAGPNPGQRPQVPKRNWIAAFSALVIVPASYYVGMRLHDLKDSKAMDPNAPFPSTPAVPSPALHQHPEDTNGFAQTMDDKTNRALVKAQIDRKKQLELNLFHLVRERQDVLNKLSRVQERRLEAQS
ncbi:uncharacterized protein MEPE_01877 [Melanopsichium pennsylvanicum]|uniref:Mitochondrial PGP phosphatase-domain-containing protein n=2 Tax=Melanopsichium pennsylvanicum TaxID=63383 RepID=A0AAJ4XJX2_9BASI|nr:conserved hypothetical protein [Melanopsichium pennsylvanicum 4]SNX83171.1 uncharacterized protein MEPE_01877 [Melanopsichium pennsylvanicum]